MDTTRATNNGENTRNTRPNGYEKEQTGTRDHYASNPANTKGGESHATSNESTQAHGAKQKTNAIIKQRA